MQPVPAGFPTTTGVTGSGALFQVRAAASDEIVPLLLAHPAPCVACFLTLTDFELLPVTSQV
ncbi:hypothetical protein GCM10027452_00150 [Micromonospora halotolerans]